MICRSLSCFVTIAVFVLFGCSDNSEIGFNTSAEVEFNSSDTTHVGEVSDRRFGDISIDIIRDTPNDNLVLDGEGISTLKTPIVYDGKLSIGYPGAESDTLLGIIIEIADEDRIYPWIFRLTSTGNWIEAWPPTASTGYQVDSSGEGSYIKRTGVDENGVFFIEFDFLVLGNRVSQRTNEVGEITRFGSTCISTKPVLELHDFGYYHLRSADCVWTDE